MMPILPGVNSKLVTIVSDTQIHNVYCIPNKIMIDGREIWIKKH